MNIIISGYGKMGREVEAIALGRNHVIAARFDQPGDWAALGDLASSRPVVIDFSQPDAVVQNILRCFEHDVPVVVGTTGWNDRMPDLKERCLKGGHTLLTASNFSIGMNLFFALNRYLASLMKNQEAYDVSISETHHIHKLDKPSGTAITLAEQILKDLPRKKGWISGSGSEEGSLPIESIREGEVFGDHSVAWDSPADRITLRHTAKNRKGFALGAVMAAEWVRNRKGCFEMRDFLGI